MIGFSSPSDAFLNFFLVFGYCIRMEKFKSGVSNLFIQSIARYCFDLRAHVNKMCFCVNFPDNIPTTMMRFRNRFSLLVSASSARFGLLSLLLQPAQRVFHWFLSRFPSLQLLLVSRQCEPCAIRFVGIPFPEDLFGYLP